MVYPSDHPDIGLVKTTVQIPALFILSHIINEAPWIQTWKDDHWVILQEGDVLFSPLKKPLHCRWLIAMNTGTEIKSSTRTLPMIRNGQDGGMVHSFKVVYLQACLPGNHPPTLQKKVHIMTAMAGQVDALCPSHAFRFAQ